MNIHEYQGKELLKKFGIPVPAGIAALSGPLHGGANAAVMSMLQAIHDEGDDGTRFIEAAKSLGAWELEP